MDMKGSRAFVSRTNELQSKTNEENNNLLERTIDVWATGLITLKPDRAMVNITVSTSQGKETASDAKNSVTRRSDYVIQTLHTHNVKEGDVTKTSSLTKSDGLFYMVTELSVVFVDFTKCQNVCNFLVEKLDDSVHISQPHFFHGIQSLDAVRRQACLLSTQNAHQKALDISRFLHQTLGRPVVIREAETKEWEGPSLQQDSSSSDRHGPQTFQQRLTNATFHVRTKVFASFEIHTRDKAKELKT